VARTPEEEGKLILQVEETRWSASSRRFRSTWSSSRPASSPAPTPELAVGRHLRAASTAGLSRSTPSSIRSDHDRGRVRRGCVSGPRTSRLPWRKARRRLPESSAGSSRADEPRADQGHGSPGALLRLPGSANTMCPYNAISFDDVKGVSSINRGNVPGLRHLCRGLPRRSDLRHRLQRRAGPRPDRGLLRVGADGLALKRSAYPEAHHDQIEEAVRA